MKKYISAFMLLLVFQTNYSQNDGVENSIFNVQTGLLGVWISHEAKLTNSMVLRSEIGLDAEFGGGKLFNTSDVYAAPGINIEPRWYYNLSKRDKNNKNVLNNSANFLTVSARYHPDWFVLSKDGNRNVSDQIAIIPKWGIRRSIGKSNFNYEAGIGLGYRYIFLKQYNFNENEGEVALDLHLKIGYTFKKSGK